MKNVSILWHKHDAGTTWFYPALQVQDRPEQKNKRNSTIQSRTIRVLMIKTVWLPIVRLNRYRMDITKKNNNLWRSDQTVCIHHQDLWKCQAQLYQLSDRDLPLHFLSFTICSQSHRHIQSYILPYKVS